MKRRILMLTLFFTVCSCAFFSLNSVSFFPAARFTSAYNQWTDSDIQDYEAIVQVAFPITNFWQYRVVVNDGVVQEAGRRAAFSPTIASPVDLSPESFTSIRAEEAISYTIEGLMSYTRSFVNHAPIIELRACNSTTYCDTEYDSQYGYVRSLRSSCGGGFLGCTISDCDGGYTVLSFTPLSL